MTKLILKGAKHFTAEGIREGDILVENGRIAKIGDVVADADATVVELCGATLFPGFVDTHVHLREPGYSHKETIATGSAAAARGGVTTLFTMPNLNPAPDSLEHLRVQLDLIERDAKVRVIPTGTITIGQRGAGELVDFESMAADVCGFSDDGRGVQADELMERAMERAKLVNRPIIAHCEVNDLLFQGYIHDGEYCRLNGHRGICSESEWGQVVRDIELVKLTGCQYHVCHISTKESVEAIRQAKKAGLPVSCETAPHYLLLTDMDIADEGRFKMNPPIRSEEDRQALIAGVQDGTVDVIATDHAPHSADEKSRGLAKSAFGVVGIEFSFAAMYGRLVQRGVISLERLVEMMATRPRELFGLEPVEVAEGSVADLVAIDLDAEYKIDPDEFLSMGRATPMAGMSVMGRTKLTLVAGEIVYREE